MSLSAPQRDRPGGHPLARCRGTVLKDQKRRLFHGVFPFAGRFVPLSAAPARPVLVPLAV